MRFAIAAAAIVLALSSASAGESDRPNENQIVRVSDGKVLTPVELIDELLGRRLIILGERHGRAEHQNREAFILSALADRGRYPGVAFEMITPSQEAVVRTYRANQPEYAMGLGSALDWWRTTWPSWSYYAPVFQVAFAAKLEIRGAELEGPVQADEPPADIKASWVQSLDESHCGLADAARLEKLATLQWRRDRRMAAAMLEADTGSGAVLIAGLAHARRDRAVPRHMNDLDLAIVGFLDRPKPDQANVTYQTDRSNYDYVWYSHNLNKNNCSFAK